MTEKSLNSPTALLVSALQKCSIIFIMETKYTHQKQQDKNKTQKSRLKLCTNPLCPKKHFNGNESIVSGKCVALKRTFLSFHVQASTCAGWGSLFAVIPNASFHLSIKRASRVSPYSCSPGVCSTASGYTHSKERGTARITKEIVHKARKNAKFRTQDNAILSCCFRSTVTGYPAHQLQKIKPLKCALRPLKATSPPLRFLQIL